MSTTTTLQLDTLSDSNKSCSQSSHQVQYIPANTDSNGANDDIDVYFNKFTRENKDKKCLENSLRGYPLEGEVSYKQARHIYQGFTRS